MCNIIIKSLLFLFVTGITNNIVFSKRVGVIGLIRNKNKISTTISVFAMVRYFINGPKKEFKMDCMKFYSLLDKDIIYYTYTHAGVIGLLKQNSNCKIIKREFVKEKRIFFEFLVTGSFNNFLRNVNYYDVWFKLK